MLPAVFFPQSVGALCCVSKSCISDSWNRNILLCLQSCLEDELWLVLRTVQSLYEKQWEHWAASTARWRVQNALVKSPKGFKPIESHQNWLQAPAELLSWLRCWLCGCEDRLCLPGSWDGIEAALFTKTYQRKCDWLIDWLIGVDFSPINDQLGAFPGCDFCLSLKSKLKKKKKLNKIKINN